MEWKTLLSTAKLAPENPEPDVFAIYPINEFEKDYNRIVSSAAFRRLQDKTQVFPLDKLGYYASEQYDFQLISDAVGTRNASGVICRHDPCP